MVGLATPAMRPQRPRRHMEPEPPTGLVLSAR
jgi:hypothetical protein